MTTAELHAHVHDEAGTTVIELAGDVDQTPRWRWTGVLRALRTVSIMLDFRRRVHQLHGIMMIVGLLTRARE
jgi:hypothetical protein